ncbi:unnamed protein product [Acanthosepion pharaonis]|uniref:Transposase n=1 Tax=Acanthosepion pharaonis TaxID=158019 RepID=A0A812DE97_ACAPH|nr:unnamed protein product [Sepia pharaonis]
MSIWLNLTAFTVQSRRKDVSQHDNARSHVERRVVECIANNGWELLPYPSYSPTEAPTDDHVNRSLKNWQVNNVYANLDNLVADFKAGIFSKNRDVFARGIDRLRSKWEAVIEVPYITLSICLSICIFIYLSISVYSYLSIYENFSDLIVFPIYLSIYLSIY